jgi:hypothetical protein
VDASFEKYSRRCGSWSAARREVDAALGEEATGLGGDVEGLREGTSSTAPDPRPSGYSQMLGHQPALVALGRVLQLEHVDGPEDGEVVELDASGACSA